MNLQGSALLLVGIVGGITNVEIEVVLCLASDTVDLIVVGGELEPEATRPLDLIGLEIRDLQLGIECGSIRFRERDAVLDVILLDIKLLIFEIGKILRFGIEEDEGRASELVRYVVQTAVTAALSFARSSFTL